MFAQLICRDCNNQKKDEIYEVLGLLCQREQIQIEDRGDNVIIKVCPEGKITVEEKEDTVILKSSTRHAGAGFHAFVIEFFMDLEEEIPGEYDLIDDLNYDGNFEQLVQIYEDEILYLKDILLTNEIVRNQNYMYDETYILPILDYDKVATSTGLIDRKEFEEMSPNKLMDCFYVWNSWDKDARFFKNCALNLLAKESVGQYVEMDDQSYKHAKEICDYVELAYENDPQLSLPFKEYLQLCTYLERTPKIASCSQMEEEVYQYRLKEVYHLHENMKVVASGMAQRSYDPTNQALCLMSPYLEVGQWDWLIQASLYPTICTKSEELISLEPIEYHGKTIFMDSWEEDGFYSVEAVLKKEEQTMYFHCAIANEKDLPYIKQCIKESEFQMGIE